MSGINGAAQAAPNPDDYVMPKPLKYRTEYGTAACFNEAKEVVGVQIREEYADLYYGGRDFMPIAEAEQLRRDNPELFWKIIDDDE